MNRYLLNVSYIGTNFRGIQKTINKTVPIPLDTSTVQGCIELALQSFRPLNQIQTVLSSRTDAGVHALHTTLHVDLKRHNEKPFNTNAITTVLNRKLDKQRLPIRVLSTQHVPDTFHCRYNALGRTYLYRIAVPKQPTDPKKSYKFQVFVPVEELDRCFFIQDSAFDIERMRAATHMFVGLHDFRTFMSTSSQKSPSSHDHPMFTLRRINNITIKPGRTLAVGENAQRAEELYNYWDIEITGRSFLYKQVRRIVGSLHALAIGLIDEQCIYQMLTVPSKNSWHPRVLLAPAFGLYLCRVHYNEKDLQFPDLENTN